MPESVKESTGREKSHANFFFFNCNLKGDAGTTMKRFGARRCVIGYQKEKPENDGKSTVKEKASFAIRAIHLNFFIHGRLFF